MVLCVRRKLGLSVPVIVTFSLLQPTLHAQQVGHYVGGITGLENGTAPPPGLFINYMAYVNPVDSIKGPNGRIRRRI